MDGCIRTPTSKPPNAAWNLKRTGFCLCRSRATLQDCNGIPVRFRWKSDLRENQRSLILALDKVTNVLDPQGNRLAD
jgi:hypothetical protein